jgi:hypothetical protein
MSQEEVISAIASALLDRVEVRGLFLVGSFGKGTADRFSDIDLLALVEEDARAGFPAAWRTILEEIAPVVFWNQRQAGGTLINVITADWTRCDLVLPADNTLRGRSRDTVRPLIDRDGLHAALPPHLTCAGPNVARVTYLIHEFIRVLGLTSVVIERGEYFTGVAGAGMQRDHLAGLMVELAGLPDPGGALHLSRLLPPDQMSLLLRLPYPKPERSALVEAHLTMAREFMPRAKAAADQLGIPWPQAFEDATLRHLRQVFGNEFDVSW